MILQSTSDNLAAVAGTLASCKLIEVVNNQFAPFYCKGDLVFTAKQGALKKCGHVVVQLKNARQLFGSIACRQNGKIAIQIFDGHNNIELFYPKDISRIEKIIAKVSP